MGLFDSIMGRSKPVRPNLDQLFAIPSAAITLQASLGVMPTGTGSVAFRAPEGKAFNDVVTDVEQLLTATSDPQLRATRDSYGYTWLTIQANEVTDLVNGLHAVNISIQDAGFGPQCPSHVFIADDHLTHASGIAQVDERHPAVVATTGYPARQSNPRTCVGCAQGSSTVTTNHLQHLLDRFGKFSNRHSLLVTSGQILNCGSLCS